MAKRNQPTLAGDVPSRQQIWESIRTLHANKLTITMAPLHISNRLGFSLPATAASSMPLGRLVKLRFVFPATAGLRL